MILGKKINGDSEVYTVMAINLCKLNNGKVKIGDRMFNIGGQHDLLMETKTSNGECKSRYYGIVGYDSDAPEVFEIVENNKNISKTWQK